MTKTFEVVVSAEQARDAAFEELNRLKIEHAKAMARARNANKDEREAAAAEAAELKAQVAKQTKALRDAEKSVSVAEKAHKEAQKAEAKAAAKQAMERRLEAAEENPFLLFQVDFPAIGAWFADRFRDQICFVEGAGWGLWTGSHWQFSTKPSARLLDLVRGSYGDEETEVVARLNANANAAESILKHAQGALELHRSVFNAPSVAHLVAFRNCTVDLRKGTMMKHNPRHYMTGCIQCDFNPKADFGRVVEAFARFWPNDTDTARQFQIALGYSMTAEVAAKRVFMMVGN